MKIFITNLPFICSEEEITAFIGQFCTVISFSLARHEADGKSRGFAFADAEALEPGRSTLELLSGKKIKDKPFYVAQAVDKDKYQRPADLLTIKKKRKRLTPITQTL